MRNSISKKKIENKNESNDNIDIKDKEPNKKNEYQDVKKWGNKKRR